MRGVVGICSALLVLAIGYLILGRGQETAAVLDAFCSQPALSKIAWLVVVLVPLGLVPAALWLGETLLRQRQAT